MNANDFINPYYNDSFIPKIYKGRGKMGRLKEKVAIITGGGGGIGRATAIRFAEEGARVIVAEIKTDLGEESAQLARDAAGNSGGDALFIETDVTSHESVKKAISATVERFGKLDILHNNAGGSTMQDGPVTEAPDDEFWRVIKLDLIGFSVSAGSACSSGKINKSHVLEAMGLEWAINNTIRVSYGWQNNNNDLLRDEPCARIIALLVC